MADHNGNKPKGEWKPPPRYESAIGKARDAAKTAEHPKNDNSRIAAVLAQDDEDTASEDSHPLSDAKFSIAALTPLMHIKRANPIGLVPHNIQRPGMPHPSIHLRVWICHKKMAM